MQMNELCLEVLEFSQGRVTLNKEIINISEYLNTFTVKLQKTLMSSNSNIKFKTDITSVSKVFADKIKIDRVLTNILFNSKDALVNTQQSPQIKLRCYDDKNNDEIVIEIEDNGKGMTEKDKKYIFDSFFTSGKAHGTGLGLTISQEIITKHHGGKIRVESKQNSGTTVIIKLPIEH